MKARNIMLVVLFTSSVTAIPTPPLSGNLSTLGGSIVATGGNWTEVEGTLAWDITPSSKGYQYVYTLTLDGGGIVNPKSPSHLIIGTSDDFGIGKKDIFNIQSITGDFLTIEIDLYGEGPDNPSIPGYIYGIKVDSIQGEGEDPVVFAFSFESPRIPVYQNFYTKGGEKEAMWNSGFSEPETGAFIVAPDTTYVPEPSSVALGFIGLSLIGWLRRRNFVV